MCAWACACMFIRWQLVGRALSFSQPSPFNHYVLHAHSTIWSSLTRATCFVGPSTCVGLPFSSSTFSFLSKRVWMIQLLNFPCSSFDLRGAKISRLTQDLKSEFSPSPPVFILHPLQWDLKPLGIIPPDLFHPQRAVSLWGGSKQGHPVLELLADLTLVLAVESNAAKSEERAPRSVTQSDIHPPPPQAENSLRGSEGAGDDHAGAHYGLDSLRDRGHGSGGLGGAPDGFCWRGNQKQTSSSQNWNNPGKIVSLWLQTFGSWITWVSRFWTSRDLIVPCSDYILFYVPVWCISKFLTWPPKTETFFLGVQLKSFGIPGVCWFHLDSLQFVTVSIWPRCI